MYYSGNSFRRTVIMVNFIIFKSQGRGLMSEVARLREQIEMECHAMRLALYGYAVTASHEVIEQKYNSLGKYQDALEQLVGEEEANNIVVEIYIKVVAD